LALPAMPKVRLAAMPGHESESAYLSAVADRVAALARRAEQSDRPADRVTAWLAAANQVLAHQVEPSCTRHVLRLARAEDEPDADALARMLHRADEFLDQADAAMEDQADGAGASDEMQGRLRSESVTLRAFAAALRAYLVTHEDDTDGRTARRAASALSPLREDEAPQVRAAASFWQACLRGLEEDSAPALAALDLAMADPGPDSMPYALFGRLLRCRLVARRGGPATASAILLQLEERLADWVDDSDRLADAIRAVQIERLHTLALWHDQLAADGAGVERQWCVDRMQALIDSSFGGQEAAVLRLTPAVPLVAVEAFDEEPADPGSEAAPAAIP
jgi:hypothetical protein